MKFLFYWTDDSGKNLNQAQLDIVQIDINHTEGLKPRLRLVTYTNHSIPIDKVGVLKIDNKVVLNGKLAKPPKQLSGNLYELVLTQIFPNQTSQLLSLRKQLTKNGAHKLFTRYERFNFPHEWLDNNSRLLYWTSKGKISLSNIVKGNTTHNLSKSLLEEPKFSYTQIPLRTVKVNLRAEWSQIISGYMDIAPMIARKFYGGIINTLTPDALLTNWPSAGKRLGGSEYRIAESSINEIKPPKTGVLNIYPQTTPVILDYSDGNLKEVKGRYCWYKASLLLSWATKQKRQEIASISLNNSLATAEKTKILNITLQNICDYDPAQASRASFFNTKTGIKAIEHAIKIAESHLVASSRCLRVEVTVPLEIGLALSLDDDIIVPHKNLIGKKLTAKVNSIKLQIRADRAIAKITALATYTGKAKSTMSATKKYTVKDCIQEDILTSGTGISFEIKEPQEDLDEHKSIVEDINVSNDGNSQTQALLANQYPKTQSARKVLAGLATNISVRLKPLVKQNKVRHYHVLPTSTYQIQNAINIEELEV